MTKVINLYGGPGCGKSTLAAGLYYELKKKGKSSEIVREYTKDYAYAGRKIKKYDQIYILGKQLHRETELYGKVDYLITDSPFPLAAFYEQYYQGIDVCTHACKRFLEVVQGVKYQSYFLPRDKPYVTEGRYENEAQADDIQEALCSFLSLDLKIDYIYMNIPTEERLDCILERLDN